MSGTITARIADAQGSPLAVAIEVSGHHLFGDEPAEREGRNLGPTPFDLLTAALGQCTAMTVRWYARQQGWPLEHVSVEVEHEKAAVDGYPGKIDVFRKTVTVAGACLTEEQRAKLVAVAARCPIQKSLEGPKQITTIAGA
jgi:putative redox protein